MKKLVPLDAVLIPDRAERVFEGEIFDVYQWPQQLFDGSDHNFEMLRRPDTVTVIPILDDKILIISDTQPHVGTKMSFPGGRVDTEDESTLAAAQREVKEETGYEFENWRLIRVTQPHPKLEWFIYFYIAWDGKKTAKPHLDPGEKIEIKLIDFNSAKNFVTQKAGYLGESHEIFMPLDKIHELIGLPEFNGRKVDR